MLLEIKIIYTEVNNKNYAYFIWASRYFSFSFSLTSFIQITQTKTEIKVILTF